MSLRPSIAALVLLPLLLLPAACASTGEGGGSGSRNLITFEALDDASLQASSAWEVIQRLRPQWLRSRASTIQGGQIYPMVYVDGSRFGELDSLRGIRSGDIEEITFVNARDATTRFGTGHAGGVIMVSTRR